MDFSLGFSVILLLEKENFVSLNKEILTVVVYFSNFMYLVPINQDSFLWMCLADVTFI
jgi:hypothetical protein